MKNISKTSFKSSSIKKTKKLNLKPSMAANDKTKLSVVMIGHNEVHHLKELLPTLNWVKEIIYVDCESNDDSLVTARKNGCKVFKRPNNMSVNNLYQSKKNPTFGIAENKSFAIKQAKEQWVLLLDPDERIEDELILKIKQVIAQDEIGGYYLNRKNYYLGKFLRYGGNYPDWQLRLFQKDLAYFSHLNVHEHLEVKSKSKGRLTSGALIHFTYENIFELLKKNNLYSSFEVEGMDNPVQNIEGSWTFISFMLFKPIGNFFNRFIVKRGFLDGFEGLVYAFFNAFKFQLRYLKMREKSRTKTKNELT